MAKTYNDALEWAAKWIEDTLKAGPERDQRTIEFGTNMAMTLRAARVHPVDEGRVEEIERWVDRHTMRNSNAYADLSRAFSEIRYLLSLLRLSSSERRCGHDMAKLYGELASRVYAAGRKGNGDVEYAVRMSDVDEAFRITATAITPTESSERRCGGCGHGDSTWNPVTALCEFDADPENESVLLCGCKCVFPATGAVHDLVARIQARADEVENAGNDSGNKKDAEFIKGGVSALRVLADDIEDGLFPVATTGADEQRCIHCDPSSVPSGPDDWCKCRCHNKELYDPVPVAEGGSRRCLHCGRRMKSDFDPDVGMWYECENCNYRNLVSANQPLAPAIQGALNEDFGELYDAAPVVEPVREAVRLTPWVSADDRAWERYANVTCVECPDCCFRFDAAHQDGDTLSYSCPICDATLPPTEASAEAGEAEREVVQANRLWRIWLWNELQIDLRLSDDAARNEAVKQLAEARVNTISECVEKLNALSTLPFDAVPYIRRDDAIAVLESLAQEGRKDGPTAAQPLGPTT
jgi:DNA-directed RNA polymerase subunit RPC12/RpoP